MNNLNRNPNLLQIKKRVAIVTNNFNCERNNQYYSTIEKYFISNGWIVVENFDVDKVVISGCGYHDLMYRKVLSTIEYLKSIHFLEKNILLMGCIAKTHQLELKEDFKGKTIYFQQEEELDRVIAAKIPFARIKPNNLFRPHGKFHVKPAEEFFHIGISRGCLKKCTFCVINKAKGYIHSTPPEEIVKQFKTAVQKGYRNICLMGEDTFAYGIDIGTTIVELVESLLEIEPKVVFDFGSLHIKWLKEYSSGILSWCKRGVIKKLLIGLQHVNEKILRLMGRPIKFPEVYEIMQTIKKISPDLYLSVDIIIGFPGETKEIFNELVDFFKKDKCIDNVSLSGFSDVKGAPSHKFPDKNSEVEISSRWSYLTEHVLGKRSPFNRRNEDHCGNVSFQLNYENDYNFCKDTFKDELEEVAEAGGQMAVAGKSGIVQEDSGDFAF